MALRRSICTRPLAKMPISRFRDRYQCAAEIMTNEIRVGPAGWSYKDWEGVVYPQKPGPRFDPLEYLSRFFDTIEINSSFYRSPTAKTATSWASRVAGNPRFNFTAKLHRIFTHERGRATDADE